MEREDHFVGKNVDKDEIERAEKDLKLTREKTRQPLEGEPPKSIEQIQFINLLNSYFAEELKELGIEKDYTFTPEQYHLMPEEIFEQNVEERVPGFHRQYENNMYINTTRFREQNIYHTMIHESIHSLSYHKFHIDPDKKIISSYRMGYEVKNPTEGDFRYFDGLTEAITERMAREVYTKHHEEIENLFHLAPNSMPGMPMVYGEFMGVVDTVISKMSEEKKEEPQEIWKRFKRGMITGEMLHLRDVENVFGKGSLRILAALSVDLNHLNYKDAAQKIKEYFTTNDEERKLALAQEILDKEEYKKYERRK